MLLWWLHELRCARATRDGHRSPRRSPPRRRLLRVEPLEERAMLSIVAGGTGDGNTTAPPDDPGFANVGTRGSGTGIYLGNGWVLTANHVSAGGVLFNDVWYNAVAGTTVQLTNPAGAGWTQYTDLILYRIDASPGLPSLAIGSAPPAVGWNVTMIGHGRDRQPSEAYWTSAWAPSATPSTYDGYIWAATQSIRWGTNTIDTVNVPQGVQTNSELAFTTSFTANTPNEAQGASGDSGGAVFHKNASTGNWELVGVMFAISTYAGQPFGTSVFGNTTYIADLSVYRDQILQTVGAVNHAPAGANGTVTTLENSPYTLATSDFGFSDPADAPPDNLLAVKIATLPTAGTLTDNGSLVAAGQFIAAADIAAGKLRFTPAAGASGTAYATFTFQVEDDGGTAGGGVDLDPSANTITVNVTPVDTAAPTVTGFTPAGGATNVAASAPITVTFSEALDPTSVTASTVRLLD
ncbi:MAG: Ig-like domain-containing protein, partial [Planctomycetia bacterium]|nr:Ig-like domain-containing protein [Planctomycetia bacterium]